MGSAPSVRLRHHAHLVAIVVLLIRKWIQLLHIRTVLLLDLLVKLAEELLSLVLFILNGSVGKPDDDLGVLVKLVNWHCPSTLFQDRAARVIDRA